MSRHLPPALAGIVTALVVLGGLIAPGAAATHEVSLVGFTFQPDTLTIAHGDSVRWIWTGGFLHTITSGNKDQEANTWGLLFDETMDSGNQAFTYVFDDTAGTYRYLCRPHVSFGMFGVIHVQAAPVAVDGGRERIAPATWGRIKGKSESPSPD